MDMFVTITGITCAGKTTLLEKMVESGAFAPVFTTTTRELRPGEDFVRSVTESQFNTMVRRGEMLEVSDMATAENVAYGTQRADLDEALSTGKIPVKILDPVGLRRITTRLGDDVAILKVGVNTDPHECVVRLIDRAASGQVDKEKAAARALGLHDEIANFIQVSSDFDLVLGEGGPDAWLLQVLRRLKGMERQILSAA